MIRRESIKKGSITTSIISVIGRVVGFLSVFLIAFYFGANEKTDVYYFMLSFTGLLSTVFTSVHTTIFLPFFIKLKEQLGEESAWRFVNSLFTYTLVSAVILSCLFFLFYNEILQFASHFSQFSINSSKTIILLFIPILTMMILLEFLRTILFAHHQFTFPALTVAFNSTLMVILILLFRKLVGIQILAYSVFCSNVFQFVLLFFYVKKNEPLFKFSFKIVNQFNEFFKLGAPIIITQIFGAFSMFFYDYTATMFTAGTLTALAYANRVATLPNDMIITPISQVLVPIFSENAAKGEFRQLTKNYYRFNTILWLIVIPISIYFILFSRTIIRILFERGGFTHDNALVASLSLQLFSVGLFGYSFNAISSRVYLALQKTLWTSVSSLLISILSIGITYVMVNTIGFQGISSSRSVSIVLLSVGSCILFSKMYVLDFKIKGILMPLVKIFICAIISGIISVYLLNELNRIIVLRISVFSLILNLTISSVFYLALYFLFCFLFKIDEVAYLIGIFKNTLKAKISSLSFH